MKRKIFGLFTALCLLLVAEAQGAVPCVKHAFTSAVADSSDPTEIRPSDWNACHTVEAGSIPESALNFNVATQTELDNHINSATAHPATSITTSGVKRTVWIPAGALATDETFCAAPALTTLNSGPRQWVIICQDNDGSRMDGAFRMPDSWNGLSVDFRILYAQSAANTQAFLAHVKAQCRGLGEIVSNTWSGEVAISDTNVTGSWGLDQIPGASGVTPTGTCAGGDMVFFRVEIDAAGTTTPMATLNILGFFLEYGISSMSD